jgi:hypothetical protein
MKKDGQKSRRKCEITEKVTKTDHKHNKRLQQSRGNTNPQLVLMHAFSGGGRNESGVQELDKVT